MYLYVICVRLCIHPYDTAERGQTLAYDRWVRRVRSGDRHQEGREDWWIGGGREDAGLVLDFRKVFGSDI